MASKIWNYIVTEQELEIVVSVVESMLTARFKNNAVTDYQQSVNVADNLEAVHILNVELSTATNKDEYLIELKKDLEKNKQSIKLTLAINPNVAFWQSVGLWIKKNLGEKVVAEFEINSSILGGAQISYLGNYYDGGLREKVDEWLVKKLMN